VVGPTFSANFPMTAGAFDASHNGNLDIFVTKVSAAGNLLLFSTFVGGGNYEYGNEVVLDSSNAVIVAGGTTSVDFPTTASGYDRGLGGTRDAYLLKLRADGGSLLYSTYLGGAGDDWNASALKLDQLQRAWLAGDTTSLDFPTTVGAFDRSLNGYGDAFVVKLAMGPPLPFDAAELASQAEYPTVTPGTPVNFWINVRNSGTTTWRASDGYGWRGDDQWLGQSGPVTGVTTPGGVWRRETTFNAPTTPGEYVYGFMMRHNGQEFGPYFFLQVTVIGYTISGRVVDTIGAGISGVIVRADSSHTATTDTAGNYTLSGLMAGVYTVQPSKNGYAFCPINRRVNISSNIANQNFTGFGATVALGFCPAVNGYNFSNNDDAWGWFPWSAYDFRGIDLIRTFGQDKVCVMAGSVCLFKPQATAWLNGMNFIMNGGHCDGMSTTSLRFFRGQDLPQQFNPNAGTARGLSLNDVRRHIAYYNVRQSTDPVNAYRQQVRQNTPSVILDQLRAGMQGGALDPAILFVRPESEGGGHTITPFAIEDKGNGVSWVRVYDNNHPNDLNRYVVIDTVQQTWMYQLSETQTWTGSANTKTLGIVPISLYAQQPIPPFQGAPLAAATDNSPKQEVHLDGSGHLLITNGQGHTVTMKAETA